MAGVSAPLTSLLGRERELEQLAALLRKDHVRLVTITGPGGVGKSRLAIELARFIENDRGNSVSVIPLAGLREAYRVPAAIAQGLGIRTDHSRTALDAVASALQACDAILLLDNFEHVIDAAPAIVRLLGACPQLKVLVTSRSVLRVSGEHDVAISPLAIPDFDLPSETRTEDFPAVRLFIQRAIAANASFTIDEPALLSIVDICRRLDGLPLAIELAAARSAFLTPQAMLQRLDYRLPLLTAGGKDRPPHQQTMRDTIAWSHDLLTEDERCVFRRLAVFPGTFSVEGAVCIASEPGRCVPPADATVSDEVEMLHLLASLADKSLISRGPASRGDVNLVMLQTVREFGLQELATSGEEREVRQRHAEWTARLAESGESRFLSPEDPTWPIYLLSELEGISAAAEFAIQDGDATTALRIAGSLWGLWSFSGQLAEGRRLLEGALAIADPGDQSTNVARAFVALGMVEWIEGRSEPANEALERALRIAIVLDDRSLMQHAQLRLSQVALYAGDLAGARDRAEQAIALDPQPVSNVWTATSRTQLGLCAMRQGDLELARRLLEQSESEHHLTGYETGRLWTIQMIADLAHERGDFVECAMWHLESLPLALERSNAWTIFEDVVGVARLAEATGMTGEATRLGYAAMRIRQRYGILPRYFDTSHLSPAGPPSGQPATRQESLLSLDEAIADALRVATAIAQQQPLMPRSATSTLTDGEPALSKRELDVLRLLADDRSNPEIADALYISRRTVEHHISSILTKLDVSSRTGAVAKAFRSGLL